MKQDDHPVVYVDATVKEAIANGIASFLQREMIFPWGHSIVLPGRGDRYLNGFIHSSSFAPHYNSFPVT